MTTITHKESRSKLRGEVMSQTDDIVWFRLYGDGPDDSLILRSRDWILPNLPTEEGAVIGYTLYSEWCSARLTDGRWMTADGFQFDAEGMFDAMAGAEWVEYKPVES